MSPQWDSTLSTVCNGSASITTAGGQPIVAVNNQNKPDTGATNTFEGAAAGADTIYIPSLSYDYSGWNSALTILKLGAGDTDVTVSYDDDDPDDTFTLTDAAPSKKLYMPIYHGQTGRFGAVIDVYGRYGVVSRCRYNEGLKRLVRCHVWCPGGLRLRLCRNSECGQGLLRLEVGD